MKDKKFTQVINLEVKLSSSPVSSLEVVFNLHITLSSLPVWDWSVLSSSFCELYLLVCSLISSLILENTEWRTIFIYADLDFWQMEMDFLFMEFYFVWFFGVDSLLLYIEQEGGIIVWFWVCLFYIAFFWWFYTFYFKYYKCCDPNEDDIE